YCALKLRFIYFYSFWAWIITSGLREGVGRCVGEAVRDHCATASSLSQAKVIAVGVAPWGLIYQRQRSCD
uniref:Transient receptor potential cation channel, subfamily M, member 4a n=1 Tax=Sinocyclocheilus rhinocerous TaxID=307959 RepID=A0A673NCS2_9TELE